MKEPKAQTLYRSYIDKTGRTWLVSEDHQEVWVESEIGNRGLGGYPRRFQLVDGGSICLIGPWASNQGSFTIATGVEL